MSSSSSSSLLSSSLALECELVEKKEKEDKKKNLLLNRKIIKKKNSTKTTKSNKIVNVKILLENNNTSNTNTNPIGTSNSNSNSNSNKNNNFNENCGDQQRAAMDAADTLVSLAHSTTPDNEKKEIFEFICDKSSNDKTTALSATATDDVNLDNLTSTKKKKQYQFNSPTEARKVIEHVLKSCPNLLESITITTKEAPPAPAPAPQAPKAPNDIENTITNSELFSHFTKRNDSVCSSSSSSSSSSISSNTSNVTSGFNINKHDDDDDDDVNGMSDNYDDNVKKNSTNKKSSSGSKRKHKSSTSQSSSGNSKKQTNKIRYGPIQVQPREKAAPTLATGRRSKDSELPPDEAKKRQERRDRNKEAAAKCRRKREEIADQLKKREDQLNKENSELTKAYELLKQEKEKLEMFLKTHEKKCKKIKLDINITNTNTNANTNAISTSNNENNQPLLNLLNKSTTTTTSKYHLINNHNSKSKLILNESSADDGNVVNALTRTSKSDTGDAINLLNEHNLKVEYLEDEQQQSLTIKKDSPMISGNASDVTTAATVTSADANLITPTQEILVVERPRNLNLPCMLLRQNSLTPTTLNTIANGFLNTSMSGGGGGGGGLSCTPANGVVSAGNNNLLSNQISTFNINATNSPTLSLNTPTFFTLTPIHGLESLQNAFSPTTPRLTFAILKS